MYSEYSKAPKPFASALAEATAVVPKNPPPKLKSAISELEVPVAPKVYNCPSTGVIFTAYN